MSAKRLRLELAPQEQAAKGWYLLIDPTPIPGYECVVEPSGMEFAEFDAHGAPGIWSHDKWNLPNALPLCQWAHKVEGNAVLVSPTFDAPEDNPHAGPVKKLFEAGRLRLSAGLDIVESGTMTVGSRQFQHITKSSLSEISFCLYGAHPNAGLKMSAESAKLCLTAAVEDGTLTLAEADSITGIVQHADPNTPDDPHAEGDAMRDELETLRLDNARLTAELAAARNPGASSTSIDLSSIPAPDLTFTREQASALLATALRETLAGIAPEIAAAVRAAVRKEFGRID